MAWCQWKRRTLLLVCLWEISISVSVSRTSAQTVLNGAVGESIIFPTRVPVSGSIIYRGGTIGVVLKKQAESYREFKNRLHWNSQSGFFSLSDLRTDDSGLYTVDDSEEGRKEDYELNMYDKVSAPQLIKLNTSPPESGLCSVLCSVRNVRGLNLSWFKGGVLLNHTSSSSTDDTLSLPLDIQQPDNDPYSCVASNPISKQTITVSITQYCLHTADLETATVSRIDILPVLLITCAAVSVIGMSVLAWRRKSTCVSGKQQNDPDLLTAVIYTTADQPHDPGFSVHSRAA